MLGKNYQSKIRNLDRQLLKHYMLYFNNKLQMNLPNTQDILEN